MSTNADPQVAYANGAWKSTGVGSGLSVGKAWEYATVARTRMIAMIANFINYYYLGWEGWPIKSMTWIISLITFLSYSKFVGFSKSSIS